jgi:hypothetical protein
MTLIDIFSSGNEQIVRAFPFFFTFLHLLSESGLVSVKGGQEKECISENCPPPKVFLAEDALHIEKHQGHFPGEHDMYFPATL